LIEGKLLKFIDLIEKESSISFLKEGLLNNLFKKIYNEDSKRSNSSNSDVRKQKNNYSDKRNIVSKIKSNMITDKVKKFVNAQISLKVLKKAPKDNLRKSMEENKSANFMKQNIVNKILNLEVKEKLKIKRDKENKQKH